MNSRRDDTGGVAVIGAGASGLMCASAASSCGAFVTVFEKNASEHILEKDVPFDNAYLGKKLLITGKGRCNLTNDCDREEFLRSVPQNPKFLYSALGKFDSARTMRFFEDNGCILKTERGRRVFPASDRSRDVLEALKRSIHMENCRFVRDTVTRVEKGDGGFTLSTASGKEYRFACVVICTGGLSYPLTGSTGDGYRFAASLGHTVKATRGSLVPIELSGDLSNALQGLSLRNVTLTLYDEKNKKAFCEQGELLFTHFGISGPLTLSCSAHIRKPIGSYRAELDLKPALDEQTLDRRLLSDLEKYPNKNLDNALCDLLPHTFIRPFLAACGVPFDEKPNALKKEQRRKLVETLKRFPLPLKALRPVEEAVITSGGVNVREVDPSTMESRLCWGLFFAGEILDVDAYTGGYNLQIAFSTGHLAGESAAAYCRTEDRIKPRAKKGEDLMKDAKKETQPKAKNPFVQIAIDGPSGVGKSTLAKAIAAARGYVYVDTGAIYRTVGLYAQRENIDPHDEETLKQHFDKMKIELVWTENGQRVMLDGEDVSEEIRTPRSSMYASAVSSLPAVRAYLLDMQRSIARKNPVVMDGRDIGTVILPNADVKIFMSADAKSRAERRYKELCEKGVETTLEDVLADMEKRDRDDSSRAVAPLKPAPDAVLFDNTRLDIPGTVEAALAIIREKLGE